MQKSSLLFQALFLVVASFTTAQSKLVQINIKSVYADYVIVLKDTGFSLNDSDHLSIDLIKFYLSGFQFFKNGKPVFKEENSYHLVLPAESNPFIINILNKNSQDFDEVQFNLGIDSITNVSGALGGDLDPTRGMYWTWSSGYINIKLEGRSDLCSSKTKDFQFHLGGYQSPFSTLKKVKLKVENSSIINIQLDIKNLLDQIELKKLDHIMSPSEEAVRISNIVANSFSISRH
ncbi:MAG: MbnP family protein [Saprospiraceae bacterium]